MIIISIIIMTSFIEVKCSVGGQHDDMVALELDTLLQQLVRLSQVLVCRSDDHM